MVRQAQHIVCLAIAFVVFALASTDAAKIHAQCDAIELGECAGKRLHDFVFQCAAKERMGVRDQRDAARRG